MRDTSVTTRAQPVVDGERIRLRDQAGMLAFVGAGVSILWLIGAIKVLTDDGPSATPKWAAALVFGSVAFVAAFLYARAARADVVVDAGGITVHNTLLTKRVEWAEIERFSASPAILEIRLRNGRRFAASAVTARGRLLERDGEDPRVTEIVERLNARLADTTETHAE
jgi:hypothetical protein